MTPKKPTIYMTMKECALTAGYSVRQMRRIAANEHLRRLEMHEKKHFILREDFDRYMARRSSR